MFHQKNKIYVANCVINTNNDIATLWNIMLLLKVYKLNIWYNAKLRKQNGVISFLHCKDELFFYQKLDELHKNV